MRAFTFTLQAALRLRQREEQAAELALSHSLARVHAAEIALRKWREEQQLTARILARKQVETLSGSTLRDFEFYARYLERTLEETRVELEAAREQAVLDEARWQDARRRRRVVEKLREKEWGEYLLLRRREEARELNEIATTRHVRLQRELDRSA